MVTIQEYINEENIINDEWYRSNQDSIICQICKNIIIEPTMCIHCKCVYCRACINRWRLIDAKCPLRCVNPNYKISQDMCKILSKLKFKCKNCNKIFNYKKIKNHFSGCNILSNYLNDFETDEVVVNGFFKKLEIKQETVFESKNRIRSKYLIFFLFL